MFTSSTTSKSPPPPASVHDGGGRYVGNPFALLNDGSAAQRSGGLMPVSAASSAPIADVAADLLSGAQQLSNDDTRAPFDTAAQVRTSPSQPERMEEWGSAEAHAGDTDMNDDDVPGSKGDVTVPVARVLTDPHEIDYTRSRVPPLPSLHELVSDSSSPSVSTEIVFDVDLYAYGRQFVLKSKADNNLCMSTRLLHRKAEGTIQYSTRRPMPGLFEHRVDVHPVPKRVVLGEAAVAVVPSSPPQASASQPANNNMLHRFHLHFDTNKNCADAIVFLSRFGLHARPPFPPVVRGMVHGIPFNLDPEDLQSYLQDHAWFVGGAPSLHITRITQGVDPAAPGFFKGDPSTTKGECYYYVLKSEMKHVLSMPAPNNAHYALTWKIWQAPKITVCSHCLLEGHTRAKCPFQDVHNADGHVHGACVMCRSFEHAIRSCPHANDVDFQCLLCKRGHHTIRSCTKYTGYKVADSGAAVSVSSSLPNAWKVPLRVPRPHSQPQPQQAPIPSRRKKSVIDVHPKSDESELMRLVRAQHEKHDELMSAVKAMIDIVNVVVAQQTQMMSMMSSNAHVSVGYGRDMSVPAGNKATSSSQSSSRLPGPSQISVRSFFKPTTTNPDEKSTPSRRASTPLVSSPPASSPPVSSLSSLPVRPVASDTVPAHDDVKDDIDDDHVFSPPSQHGHSDSDSDDSVASATPTSFTTKHKHNNKRAVATPQSKPDARTTNAHAPTSARALNKTASANKRTKSSQ